MTREKNKLLVLEDEKNLGSTLVERLKEEGFQVTWCRTREEAEYEISQTPFHLALLDIGLPDGSGYEIATQIRNRDQTTAIIFLTAFGRPEDRIKGLELGAEDYVVKPFHFNELLLRIKNGLKRAHYFKNLSQESSTKVTIGKAQVDFSKFSVEVSGSTQALTHKECSILRLLYERRGQVVSRDEILNHGWSDAEYPTSRTVDNFIVKLRKILEKDPENPEVIKSIRGVGYQLLETE